LHLHLRRRSPGPPFPPDHRQAGERGAIRTKKGSFLALGGKNTQLERHATDALTSDREIACLQNRVRKSPPEGTPYDGGAPTRRADTARLA
jgi:hypothetical protein